MTTELRAYNAKGEPLFITPDADAPQFETFETVGAAFDRMESLKSAWRWDRERAGHVAADGFVRNRIAYFRMDDEHWTREQVAAHAEVRAARKSAVGQRAQEPTAEGNTAQCDLHSCGGCAETCCPPVEVFTAKGDNGMMWNACRACIRTTGATPVNGWTGEPVALPETAEEPVSAPQEPEERPAAPVAPAAPATPALGDLAKITEETVTIGHGPHATVRPAYVAYAYGKVHEFADMGGVWVEVCGRCAGEGVTPFRWVDAGICYGCNGTGLRPDIFTGTTAERDAFVYAWAVKQDRQRQADEKRAARVEAKRLKAWARFEEQHGALVAWCRSLAPDSTDTVLHDRCAIEDTREEAVKPWGAGEQIIDGPRRLPADGPEGGRWWVRMGTYETREYFDSYGSRAAGLIREVRRGFEPLDAKGAAFLSAVMRRAVEAQEVSRYAGAVGEQVTVTGRVRVVMTVDGWQGRSQRLVIVEGTGEHAGVTVKTYTTASAAWSLEKGQEGVTVTGTVSRRQERQGARETTVKRPKISA